MKQTASILILAVFLALTGCNKNSGLSAKLDGICTDKCRAKNGSTTVSCKLTTVEKQERKNTVLESLRKKVLEKKELANGYAFKFEGTDKMLDELTEFIKTERECCNFFTFNLSIGGDKNEIWLELTGPEQAKELIKSELEL